MMHCAILAATLFASGSALRIPDPVDSHIERGTQQVVHEVNNSDGKSPGCAVCHPQKMLTNGTLTARFHRCALVGSSHSMIGTNYGPKLDTDFDTIIRVNRLPTPEYFRDFGSRTDVLFAGAVAEAHDMFTQQGQKYKTFGGKVNHCEYSNPSCPFKNLVLKGADVAEGGLPFEKRYPRTSPGWLPKSSTFPIAHQSEELDLLSYKLLNSGRTKRYFRPTNGLQAFIYSVVVCDSVDVFGFTGGGTADGHDVNNDVHNLKAEHKLISALATGKAKADIKMRNPHCTACLLQKIGRHSVTVH